MQHEEFLENQDTNKEISTNKDPLFSKQINFSSRNFHETYDGNRVVPSIAMTSQKLVSSTK